MHVIFLNEDVSYTKYLKIICLHFTILLAKFVVEF